MTQQFYNELVATCGVLYIKLHQFHWFVEGKNFFTLHERFEDYYDDVNTIIDDAAERLLAIGGSPVSTLKEFLELSWITESPYTQKIEATEMVRIVKQDFRTLIAKLQEGLDITAADNDDASNDYLVGLKRDFEKRVWMLDAYLK